MLACGGHQVLALPDQDSRQLEPILIMTLILCLAAGLIILYATGAIFDALGSIGPEASLRSLSFSCLSSR